MRKLFPILGVTALFAGLTLVARADEKKEVTITGEGLCAKCALKEKDSCQNVVIAKEDGKEVKYFLAKNDVAKKAHSSIGFCSATKDEPIKVKVTGTVAEKDGEKELTATKIEKVTE